MVPVISIGEMFLTHVITDFDLLLESIYNYIVQKPLLGCPFHKVLPLQ